MSKIDQYADIHGIERKEARAWVMDYIKRPGQFPTLIAAGLIEGKPEERKASIEQYIDSQIAGSVTGRIKAEAKKNGN